MRLTFPSLEFFKALQVKQIEEYFQRLRRAGFEERIEKSKFRDLLAMISLTNQEAALPT